MTEIRLNENYDVLIVGAGPAGLFAAKELVDNNPSLKILIVDRGSDVNQRFCPVHHENNSCKHCKTCNIMCGVGGAGTFSDGTLNECTHDIGGNLNELTGDFKSAQEIIDQVSSVYVQFGAPKGIYNANATGVEKLKTKAFQHGAKFIAIQQRHIGSDNAPKLISNFSNYLQDKGVDFLLNTVVSDLIVEQGICKGVKIANEQIIKSNYVIIAPGRFGGSSWVGEIAGKHGIKSSHGPIDVGVRIEVPYEVMKPITDVNRDPKIHIFTPTNDDFLRTFCTNLYGFVVKEEYENYVCTNGHSKHNSKSPNTNFAFLVRLQLTHPVGDTSRYGRSIARLATTIGGGKPVLQRYADLKRGRRSDFRKINSNFIMPTLKDVTPGDLSMALPGRIITDIKEGLEILNQIIPGVAASTTLIYGAEIKFYSLIINTDKKLETSIKNLYAAGDITEHSRDIIKASSTGIIVARGILNII